MKIRDIIVKSIFDSRGEKTIEVGLKDENNNLFSAQIPSGKSRGKNEAAVLGYASAQKVVRSILEKKIIGRDFNYIRELDNFLISLDNTKNKSKIGGNLILGISIAFSRMIAFMCGKELWEVLSDEFFGGRASDESKKPLIFSNLINGGEHANNNLDIQEYMVVVGGSKSVSLRVKKLISFYKKLGDILKTKNKLKNIVIGDEGGYAINFKNNFEPINILEKLIYKNGLEKEFFLGLDAAANSFYGKGGYSFGGRKVNTEELRKIYSDYFKKSKLLHLIEDPFAETDKDEFKKLKNSKADKIVVGDDLTVTNPFLIEKYAKTGLINGVIIKPNQIGTVTESCEAMLAAKENKIKTIVSHRSGETKDNFIIHLAKAGGAYGVKIGAPVRERILKFDELIRIYD